MHAPTVAVAEQTPHRIGHHLLSRAVLAGFAASLTMLLLFLVAYNLSVLLASVPSPQWPVLVRQSIIHPAEYVTDAGSTSTADAFAVPRGWLTNLTHNRLVEAGLSDVYLAAGVYFAGGLLWAILYAFVEPRLRGPAWRRGVVFAMVPALVSLIVVLPLFGAGPFGMALGAGPLPIVGNVALHLVYGAILGVVYGPFGDRDATTLELPTDDADDPSWTSYEPTTALLLLGGLVVGALAGLLVSALSGNAVGPVLLGESSAALILWGGLLGAVLGLFVGSFVGLGRTAPHHADR